VKSLKVTRSVHNNKFYNNIKFCQHQFELLTPNSTILTWIRFQILTDQVLLYLTSRRGSDPWSCRTDWSRQAWLCLFWIEQRRRRNLAMQTSILSAPSERWQCLEESLISLDRCGCKIESEYWMKNYYATNQISTKLFFLSSNGAVFWVHRGLVIGPKHLLNNEYGVKSRYLAKVLLYSEFVNGPFLALIVIFTPAR